MKAFICTFTLCWITTTTLNIWQSGALIFPMYFGFSLQHGVPQHLISVTALSSLRRVGAQETCAGGNKSGCSQFPAGNRKKFYYYCLFTWSAVFWAKMTFFSREEQPAVKNCAEKLILQFLFRQVEP